MDNKTVPYYYGLFREKVLQGEIPVCNEISLEMNRIDRLIDDPRYYYSREPVDAFIRFCEDEMVKTDGTPLVMLDTFKLWAEQLFGWYYFAIKTVYIEESKSFEEVFYLKRLISKQYLIVARGAAKSMYLAFVQAYFLFVSKETTHQVATAPTMRQAEETLIPIRVALKRAVGPMFKFFTTQLPGWESSARSNIRSLVASTKKGIEAFYTGSLLEIRPMTIAKLQGLRPPVSTIDEWLSGDVRENVVGALEQGASKLDEWIIIAASSEGTVRNAAGDEIKYELMKILKDEYHDVHTSIFYYKLDDLDEVGNPEMWRKAQPNIGITVSYEAYERDVRRMEAAPSTRNDILAKRFGIPMSGYTYFFTYAETVPHEKSLGYAGMDCSMGADMSQGDDFCSFTFLFPTARGYFGIKSINFITERTYKGLPASLSFKYGEFVKEGSLYVLDGTILDMTEVYEVVEEVIEKNKWNVVTVGYDPYNADTFIKLWTQNNGPYGLEIVRQGVRTESVPLGELKKLSEDRLLVFDEAIFSFAMGNAMVMVDNNGNQKLYKLRYEYKIDPVSALLNAFVVWKNYPNMFD